MAPRACERQAIDKVPAYSTWAAMLSEATGATAVLWWSRLSGYRDCWGRLGTPRAVCKALPAGVWRDCCRAARGTQLSVPCVMRGLMHSRFDACADDGVLQNAVQSASVPGQRATTAPDESRARSVGIRHRVRATRLRQSNAGAAVAGRADGWMRPASRRTQARMQSWTPAEALRAKALSQRICYSQYSRSRQHACHVLSTVPIGRR